MTQIINAQIFSNSVSGLPAQAFDAAAGLVAQEARRALSSFGMQPSVGLRKDLHEKYYGKEDEGEREPKEETNSKRLFGIIGTGIFFLIAWSILGRSHATNDPDAPPIEEAGYQLNKPTRLETRAAKNRGQINEQIRQQQLQIAAGRDAARRATNMDFGSFEADIKGCEGTIAAQESIISQEQGEIANLRHRRKGLVDQLTVAAAKNTTKKDVGGKRIDVIHPEYRNIQGLIDQIDGKIAESEEAINDARNSITQARGQLSQHKAGHDTAKKIADRLADLEDKVKKTKLAYDANPDSMSAAANLKAAQQNLANFQDEMAQHARNIGRLGKMNPSKNYMSNTLDHMANRLLKKLFVVAALLIVGAVVMKFLKPNNTPKNADDRAPDERGLNPKQNRNENLPEDKPVDQENWEDEEDEDVNF